MALLSKPEISGSHWYKPDGMPCHHVDMADGSQRATTLRDARKMNLYPSVTGICSVIDRPGLADWRVRQCVDAAVRMDLDDPVSDKMYRAVKAQAFSQVDVAANLGSKIHDAIEVFVRSGDLPKDEDALQLYVRPVARWLSELQGLEVEDVEKVVVNHDLCVAGRADLLGTFNGRGVVIDWKTRKTKEGEKVRSYAGQDMQLAAYGATEFGADRIEDMLLANVVISTTEPGRIEVLKHATPAASWLAFRAATCLWKHLKNYAPTPPQ
jgi:hypothetical protein